MQKTAQQSGKYAARCAAGYNPTEEPSDITAVPRTPAAGGRPSSVTVRAAPHRATFPKGKALCSAQSTGFAAVRSAAVRPDLPRCETQHYNPSVAPKARQLPLHRGAENARHCRGALRRSYARRRRAALIRRGAGCAAPRHLPQGEGYVLRTAHTHKHFARRAKCLTHAAGVDFTAPQARFHTPQSGVYHCEKQRFSPLGGFFCAKK